MAKVRISKGKFDGISVCADDNGVIAAAAMDQRGSLQKAIAKARGDGGTADAADMLAFKTAVTKVLTRHASAILMDPEYGLDAIKARAPGTGVLLAYEKTGDDVSVKGRLPDLLPEWEARCLVQAGADAIRFCSTTMRLIIRRLTRSSRRLSSGSAVSAPQLTRRFSSSQSPTTIISTKRVLSLPRRSRNMSRATWRVLKPRYGVDVLRSKCR